MIQTIVFDLGGVLIDFDPDRTLRTAFDEADTKRIQSVLFDSGLWKNLDLGVMHLPEIADRACEALPSRMHAPLREMLLDWWSYMPPIDGMEGFVRELKDNGYTLCLLSNTSDDLFLHMDDYPVLSLLDGVCASCEYGLLKPDARLYAAFYRRFSLDPSTCFFIDDLPQNIDGAARTGMTGHCFADRDLSRLRAALRRQGVRI